MQIQWWQFTIITTDQEGIPISTIIMEALRSIILARLSQILEVCWLHKDQQQHLNFLHLMDTQLDIIMMELVVTDIFFTIMVASILLIAKAQEKCHSIINWEHMIIHLEEDLCRKIHLKVRQLLKDLHQII